MATINRYDVPAQSEIINTYSPIPFQALAQAGMARQQRYDQAAEQELQFDPTAGPSLNYITLPGGGYEQVGDRAQVEAAQAEFETRLGNLSQAAGTADRGDPAYQRELRRLYRDLAKAKSPAGVFGRAAANVDRYKAIQEQIAENPDIQRAPWLANQLNQQLSRFAQSSRAEEGIVDLQAPAGIGEYVDRTALTDEAIDGINSQVLSIIDNPQEALNNPGYIQTGKFTGISRDKVKSAVRSYLSTNNPVTNDLADQMQYLASTGNYNEEELEKMMQQEQRQIENYLVSKYTESDASYNLKTDAEYGRKADNNLTDWTPMTFGATIFQEERNKKFDKLPDKITFNEDGEIASLTNTQESDEVRAILAGQRVIDISDAVRKSGTTTELLNELMDTYGDRPELQDMPTEQKLNTILDFIKANATSRDKLYSTHPQATEPFKENLISSLGSSNFDIVGKGQHTSNITGRNSVAKELGYKDPSELVNKLREGDLQFRLDFNTGKFVAEVPDVSKKGGKAGHKYLLFDLDEESKAMMSTAKRINDLYHDVNIYPKEAQLRGGRTPNPSMTPIGTENGVPVYVYVAGGRDITNPNKNDKQLYKYNPDTGQSTPISLRDVNNMYTKKISKRYAAETQKLID